MDRFDFISFKLYSCDNVYSFGFISGYKKTTKETILFPKIFWQHNGYKKGFKWTISVFQIPKYSKYQKRFTLINHLLSFPFYFLLSSYCIYFYQKKNNQNNPEKEKNVKKY